MAFRTINVLRLIAAFALAHLGAVVYLMGFFALTDFDPYQLLNASMFEAFYVVTVMLSVPITVVLGIPSFFLCRYLNKTGLVACALGGGVVGVLPFIIGDFLDFRLPFASHAFPAGVFSGALFWLIGVYRNPLAKRNLAGTEALGEEKAGFPLTRE
jgi:hypothetical protein